MLPSALYRYSPQSLRPAPHRLPRDPVAPVDCRARLGRPLRVRWEGDQSLLSSLALVNRELCLGLLEAGDVELTLAEQPTPWNTLTERDDPRFAPLFARRGVPLSGPVDVTIRHHFPPHWRRPETGKLVILQPWEHSHLPREWTQGAITAADEVWAYSRFVRDVYVRSGVAAEKVHLIPLGFNPAVFTPEGSPYPLPTEKSVRFLFVGGTLNRKGADLLLSAYWRTFTPDEDVCLVVKDLGAHTFYEGMNMAAAFRRSAASPLTPEILYLEDDLAEPELAALYRACSCVILPYRAEGFALPVLEGMACGKPAIVTSGGPTDDYLDDQSAFRLPHYRSSGSSFNIGAFECVGPPGQLEPDREALVETLRWVRDHPEETRARGEAARAQVYPDWTWEKSVAQVRERLLDLVAPPPSPFFTPPRPWAGGNHEMGEGSNGKVDNKRRRPSRSKQTPPVSALAPAGPIELSLCMIVRDEEPRLGKCLESIAPYVDEMVVVDTGSTDRTREVAREYGARVFDFPWVDSFSIARNQSLDQARGKWILRMDADDVITPEHAARLRELIRRYPDHDVAYLMEYRVPPGPSGTGEHVVDQVQLWPNRPDLRFEHRLHEQLLPAILRAGLTVLYSGLTITHQNYDWSPEGQAKRRRRDFRLLEMDLREQPDHPMVLFNLGMAHLQTTREYEMAVHYFTRSLEHSDWRASTVRLAYALLAKARLRQEDWQAALEANEAGRAYYPEDAELLLQAGQIYQQVGRWEEARASLERLVLGYDEPHYRCADGGLRTYRGRHELARLLCRLGHLDHGEQILREVTMTYPAYLPAQIHLAETLHALGRADEARALVERIPEVERLHADLQRTRQLVGAG
jgi:glycosyltransferase involved in cell wall biosynthesis